MARHIITCDGYATIRALGVDEDPVAACAAEEFRRADGFRVVASRDGLLFADADGLYDDADDGRAYRSAIDSACGY